MRVERGVTMAAYLVKREGKMRNLGLKVGLHVNEIIIN
jgi:hypothetical protein